MTTSWFIPLHALCNPFGATLRCRLTKCKRSQGACKRHNFNNSITIKKSTGTTSYPNQGAKHMHKILHNCQIENTIIRQFPLAPPLAWHNTTWCSGVLNSSLLLKSLFRKCISPKIPRLLPVEVLPASFDSRFKGTCKTTQNNPAVWLRESWWQHKRVGAG